MSVLQRCSRCRRVLALFVAAGPLVLADRAHAAGKVVVPKGPKSSKSKASGGTSGPSLTKDKEKSSECAPAAASDAVLSTACDVSDMRLLSHPMGALALLCAAHTSSSSARFIPGATPMLTGRRVCRRNDREAEFQAKIAKIKAGGEPTF